MGFIPERLVMMMMMISTVILGAEALGWTKNAKKI